LRHFSAVLLLALGLVGGTWAAPPAEGMKHYALILSDAPVAERVSEFKGIRTAAAASYRTRIQTAQVSIERQLAQRNIRVTGAVRTALNAVFVIAYPSQVNQLLALPGVKGIAPLRRRKLLLNKAVGLEDIPAAWTALGGESNAGAGVKIALIDTGVDITRPAFQDPSMQLPAGFTPICTELAYVGYPNENGAPPPAQACPNPTAFTSNKVIVARSYVAEGAFAPDETTRPDDISPRDRIGHGTANAMISAGGTNTSPIGISITGMAPKAWIGSYKVFGSEAVNPGASDEALISALDDALNDGMNVASMSLGGAATSGPLDTGAICGLPPGPQNYCDPVAATVANAITAGMLVVAAAGNDATSGVEAQAGIFLTLGSTDSPGTVPAALTVGASTNSHWFEQGLAVPGLGGIAAAFGEGAPVPVSPLTAPLSDVLTVDSTGLACNPLPANSLAGTMVLVNRGTCTFFIKQTYAGQAGAVAVIFVDDVTESLIAPNGLDSLGIPAALISSSDGATLRSYLKSNPGAQATLQYSYIAEVDLPVGQYNTVTDFSSRGPSITGLLKPDALGVGGDTSPGDEFPGVYMATETYDSDGAMWDPSGYTAASGTSFATPMLAGTAALVLQKNPGFTPAQLKSAVVGAANQIITDPNDGTAGTGTVTATGNGLLDGGKAVAAKVTTDPATLSFGGVAALTFPAKQILTITCSAAASLSLSIAGNSAPSLSTSSVACAPGTPQTVTATVSSNPGAGFHQGALTIKASGAAVAQVPYLITVGDGQPADIIPISSGFDDPVNQLVAYGLAFRVIDQYGVSVPNAPVAWGVISSLSNLCGGPEGEVIQTNGEGTIQSDATTTTDPLYGVAYADALLGPDAGTQGFYANAGNGLTVAFCGTARATPTINAGGAVNAASYQASPGIVPGSYISLFGTSFGDVSQNALAVPLPLGLSENGYYTGTSVSFEVPSAGISLPGPMLYADANQINVQVPWELAGQTSVQIRVNVGDTTGQILTVPVAPYAPAIYFLPDDMAAALDSNMNLITTVNQAVRGQVIQLFVNGLGAVSNQPADGVPALASPQPLSKTSTTPTVTVGGQSATVSFSGLAPGFPGLYQVNLTVPTNISASTTPGQPVVVSIGGVSSPAVDLPVK